MNFRFRKLVLALAILSLALTGPPLLRAQAYRSEEILANFTLVLGGISRVDEHTVAALFHNSENALAALVIFPAECRSQQCAIGEPLGCAIFDAEGRVVQLYAVQGAESFAYPIMAAAVAAFETA
jgi:hypothetical protein